MAKDPDDLKLRAGVKQTLEQAHLALDAYFEFLKKSVSSFPSGGTELGEKLRDQGVEHINALQEVVKKQRTFKKLFEYIPVLYTRS